MPILAALVAAVLFAFIYPSTWPEQAQRPDDPIGYWVGTLLIPGVWLITYVLPFVNDQRQRVTEGQGDEENRGPA